MLDRLSDFANSTGFVEFDWRNAVMLLVAFVVIYLAIRKKFEPLLLLGIGFGILLANLPMTGLLNAPPESGQGVGGLIYYLSKGVSLAIYPPLIFLGIGALTDFSPLIANPKTFLMGAGAQLGIFVAMFLALAFGFDLQHAGSIGIIGGADGPTAIYTTIMLCPDDPGILGIIAICAYSYMALVPLIQPPIMRLLTTKKERMIVMEQTRSVSRTELLIFPIFMTVLICLILPPAAPLIGMLMLGNLLRESGVTDRLAKTSGNELLNIVTIFLTVCVGAKMEAHAFLTIDTIEILFIGLVAFCVGTAGGIMVAKIMNLFIRGKGKVNPLIGAAGVSAVPMAARVVHKEGLKYNPSNFLLPHAMGPNVAGVVGSATVAGLLLSFYKG
ncbi:MAG: sodium ion-translocating decarboxylase subunit beta [Dehalococcoidia bacterium]